MKILSRLFRWTHYGFKVHKAGFSCMLPLAKRTYFKLYECPGAWASDQKLKQIVRDLRQIAQEGQEGKPVPEYGVLEGSREDLSQRVISIAYDSITDEPIGFSAQIYLPLTSQNFCEKVLHLGLIYISPKAQGKNISYLLAVLPNILILLKSGLRPIWVSNVSQIPAVVGLVEKNYYNAYPSSEQNRVQTFMHRKLAELIMKDHRKAFGVGDDAGFDPDQQIITNAYTGGSDNMKKTFEETKKHRDVNINELCQKNLNYERGDDFLQLAILGPQGIVELFKNKKSRQSRMQLVFNLCMFSLFLGLLPVFRWLIPGDSFSPKNIKHNEVIYG